MSQIASRIVLKHLEVQVSRLCWQQLQKLQRRVVTVSNSLMVKMLEEGLYLWYLPSCTRQQNCDCNSAEEYQYRSKIFCWKCSVGVARGVSSTSGSKCTKLHQVPYSGWDKSISICNTIAKAKEKGVIKCSNYLLELVNQSLPTNSSQQCTIVMILFVSVVSFPSPPLISSPLYLASWRLSARISPFFLASTIPRPTNSRWHRMNGHS